jgi:hypothetical protein
MSGSGEAAGGIAVNLIWYETAVPLLSFGGAALAILLWSAGLAGDLRFTAAGCVVASFALAYLAWIRPKKDIVALTTPIYAIIFFAVPLDDPVATIVLEVLYAVSLTALLVRLKYRFGTPAAVVPDGELSGALAVYVEKTGPTCTGQSPTAAHRAATAFLRYAAGDYAEVGPEVREGLLALDRSGCGPAFATALEILQEQAEITEKSRARPVWYRQFAAADEPLLARPLPPEKKTGDGYDPGYDAALDNALLLVFAVAWNASPADRAQLLAASSFAARVLEG